MFVRLYVETLITATSLNAESISYLKVAANDVASNYDPYSTM